MKSLQEHFEQERMREPIVDAVGVERFVESLDTGHRSETRSWKISAAGIVSAFLLTMVIVVISTLFGTEGEEGGLIMAHQSDARSRLLVDTPQVDRLTPSPSNEKRDEVGTKDSTTTMNDPVKKSRKRKPTKPVADADEAAITEPATARRPTLKTTDVKRDGPDTVIKNLERSTVADPKRSARLLRDSIANANALRTLHIDGIIPLTLNAQELWLIDIRIERDSARLFKGAMSDGSAMTFVFSLATGHMDVSMIYDDKALYLDSFAQQPRDGIMPRMVTDMTGNRTLSNMSAPSFAPRAHRNIADSMSSYVAPEIDSAGRLMNKEAIAMQGKRQDRIAERIGLFEPNHLLPIRLAHPYSPDSIGVIFWYDPVPALLNKLPRWSLQEIREQMRRTDRTQLSGSDKEWTEYAEYVVDSLLEMRSSSIESVDVSQAVRGDNLFNIGTADGAIASSSITPNPIAGAGRVTITLKRPRALELRLLDLQGKMIRRLSDEGHYDAGTVEIAVDLADVTPGIYLLSITTDKGEQVVHRVVAG